jgi:hypothetical protein
MRCKSHFLLFKTDKCMKGAFKFMKKTAICYFCARKLKKIYGFTENDLLKDNFYKNFISTDKDFLQTIGKMKLNTLNS